MLLITGSGTSAMEMAISSVVPPGKKILVIANGAFGDRLDEIAALHGIARVTLRYAWGTLPNVRDVARALETDPDIAAAAMIQHETSVGIMNPIGDIARLCRAHGVTSIVDAVSALGVEDVDVVRDGVDICYSSANKCLHSVSGVSFLCVAPEVWPRIAGVSPRVYYLDLARHRRYLDELSQTPFTPAVSSFFAKDPVLFTGVGTAGVFRSADGGRTWSPAGLEGQSVRDLVWLGPILYAATDEGLYRSDDVGKKWVLAVGLAARPAIQILFPLAPDSGLEAFLANEDGIVHTADGGAHWKAAGAPEDRVLRLATFPPPDRGKMRK